jgi:L-gulono-1,4-lactone dehydrogenase
VRAPSGFQDRRIQPLCHPSGRFRAYPRHAHSLRLVAAEWRNWTGDEACRPAAIEHPASPDEVADAVHRARERDLRVKVAGSGHSFNGVALTDGVMLDLGRMARVIEADRATGLVRAEAGISLRLLGARLAALGLAFETLGDIDAQTLGGAISTGTHSTGVGLPNISAQVEAIELVTGDGETRELGAGDGDLLLAARVGVGALGAVTAVTLRAVPAFILRRVDEPRPLGEVLADLDELAEANDHFEFFAFPHTETALVVERNRTGERARPRGRLTAWASDVLFANHVFGLFARAGRRFPAANPALARFATRLLRREVRVDRSEAIFASERRVRFTEMEYALPREHGAEAVRRVVDLVGERRIPVLFPIEFRLVAGDDALLSPAHGRPTAFIAVHQFEGMEWRPYFEATEAIMRELGGRPHWGKRHSQTAATLAPLYPRWDAFQRARAELDPAGTFANDYTARVLG